MKSPSSEVSVVGNASGTWLVLGSMSTLLCMSGEMRDSELGVLAFLARIEKDGDFQDDIGYMLICHSIVDASR